MQTGLRKLDQPLEQEEFSIGYWIKRRRKALDMTQKDLADRVGCALITIAKIEADQRKPSREIAGLLAEHLNIPVEQHPSFIQILRGLKSPLQLRKIAVPDFQAVPQTSSSSPISSADADRLRGMELVGKISRSKLVGRGAELTMAQNLWREVRAGKSQVLIFRGEPGIGKSRLARELINEITALGGQALTGECFSEGGMPYAPIIRILQSQHSLPLEPPAIVLSDLKNVAPQLALYMPDVPANPPLDAHAEQLRLFESIHTYFRHLYEKKPLLIVVEDVHWADHGSIAVIQSLMHRFRQMNAPVLMVLTTRDVSASAAPALAALFDDLLRAHISTTIHLERFDQNGTRDLLAAIFAQEITDEFIQLMHRETQGNPFFIEEACKDLIESRQIYWEKGRWERKEITELRVPQNVRTAIQARLAKLGKETHDLLQTASAIGRRFEFDVLRHILPDDEDQLIEQLEAAQAAQIIRETGHDGEFEFSHVLIASVLRDEMSTPRRRNVHRRIVTALEKAQPNNFSLLAYHAREATENETAITYLHTAGDQAMRAFAHEDAIRFYSEALGVAKPDTTEACQLLLARAKVYDLRGERTLQLADLQEAEAKAEVTQDIPTRAAVALARAEYAIQVTEQAEVIDYARRAIALSETLDLPATTAQGYMLWGRALSETGELNEATERLVEAGRIARQAGLGLIEMRSLINLGNVDYRRGDYLAARDKYVGSLDTLRRLGERRIECMVINNLGNINWTQGDLETALHHYNQALEIAQAIGDRLNEARALSNMGSILTEQHQYAEALQRLEQALPILRDLGQQVDEGVVLGHIADVMDALGRYDESFAYKREARDLTQEADDPQSVTEFLIELSRTEIFRENYESAAELARQAIAIASEQDYPVEAAAAWQALGLAYITAGKQREAEEAYATALALYEALNQESKSTELHAELAWVAHERGDIQSAKKHLEFVISGRSPEVLKSMQRPSVCWCFYEVLKDEESEIAKILLENGYNTLRQTLEKISDPRARAHYSNKLSHHADLLQAWNTRTS